MPQLLRVPAYFLGVKQGLRLCFSWMKMNALRKSVFTHRKRSPRIFHWKCLNLVMNTVLDPDLWSPLLEGRKH